MITYMNPPTHRDERVEPLAYLPTYLNTYFLSSFLLFFLSSEPLTPKGGGLPPPLPLP